MKLKKILVAALAVTMIMGSSSMAFAAEQKGQGEGSGDLDIVKNSDVFSVVIPTDSGTTFDYIVDPLGVIKDTNAEKYGNKSFDHNGDPTVFFQNTDVTSTEAPYNYTGTSNKLKAINKSTKKVDVKVEATLTDTSEVTMVEASAATGTSDTLLNLQLQGDNSKSEKIVTSAEISDEIAAKANAYETKYVNGEYVKQIKSGLEDKDFPKYEFWLTGAANPSSSWQDVTNLPQVKLVWTVTGEGGEATSGPRVTVSESGLITVSGLTADKNVNNGNDDIKFGVDGGLYNVDNANVEWTGTEWSAENGGVIKIQMKSLYNVYNGKTVNVEVTLKDGTIIRGSGVVNIQ